jgi:hypothetical protein
VAVGAARELRRLYLGDLLGVLQGELVVRGQLLGAGDCSLTSSCAQEKQSGPCRQERPRVLPSDDAFGPLACQPRTSAPSGTTPNSTLFFERLGLDINVAKSTPYPYVDFTYELYGVSYGFIFPATQCPVSIHLQLSPISTPIDLDKHSSLLTKAPQNAKSWFTTQRTPR